MNRLSRSKLLQNLSFPINSFKKVCKLSGLASHCCFSKEDLLKLEDYLFSLEHITPNLVSLKSCIFYGIVHFNYLEDKQEDKQAFDIEAYIRKELPTLKSKLKAYDE
ncbi:MAG: hypothetical protein GQ570_13745 [Helicobacteraceae bacterium]|nr:hypothetical protein [Helicobacteraceae bacterium]